MAVLTAWMPGFRSNITSSCSFYLLFYSILSLLDILYFAWDDQSDAVHCIVHTVLISSITVLYESYSTVMHLIGQIQYSYAENLFKECYKNNPLGQHIGDTVNR